MIARLSFKSQQKKKSTENISESLDNPRSVLLFCLAWQGMKWKIEKKVLWFDWMGNKFIDFVNKLSVKPAKILV